MSVNNYFTGLSVFGLVIFYFTSSLAEPSAYSNLPSTVDNRVGSKHSAGGLASPQLSNQQNKHSDRHPNSSHLTPPQTSSVSTPTTSSFSSSSSLLSTEPLQPTYVYKAVIPTYNQPESHQSVSALKSSNANSPSRTATKNSSLTLEKDDDLSKKIIGSSVVTSVSVILNGNQPEFTDALGQKVPKPQPSLQVASPIDLLNPDRYEFYTFDEHGELVKRLMTMEEIQSIVANGDGEGPTIIHHGPIEDRDPEKNVQDIVNSVQSVLNKEVESNKNTSMENLPVFDTPDVSSTWSMILPAIFGNTGSVDIFSQQKPQQIVMTPESEIIETSTKKVISSTTKKAKPGKRKPGQKRKSTTTTTEMTPQVIQEELDSQESVYTGMQQYQNLAASMQNYDGFSQLHIQPIYHKLPEIEATTRRVFINNQEVVKKPTTDAEGEVALLNESFAKKPGSVHRKPLPPHRVKKPNVSHATTKAPQSIKQKRKPTVTTAAPTTTSSTTPLPSTTPVTTTESTTTTTTTTTTVVPITTTTTTVVPTTTSSTTSTPPPDSTTTAIISTTKYPKKKKKPIRHRVSTTTASPDTSNSHVVAQKKKPSAHPHRRRPSPTHQHTKYPHVAPTTDLTPAGSAHQDVSHNKTQFISHSKKRPKPVFNPTPSSTTTTEPTTTETSSPAPTTTTPNTADTSVVIKHSPGKRKPGHGYEAHPLPTKSATTQYRETTYASVIATSGTSGYPVPSYDLPTSEQPENLDFYQYKSQPLSLQSLTRDENKPNQQDVHTLQSFDQIMQTLKNPAHTSSKLNNDQSSEKFGLTHESESFAASSPSNPVDQPLDDSTKSSTPEDLDTTSNLPHLENTSIKGESNKPHRTTTEFPEAITTYTPMIEITIPNTETTANQGLTHFADVVSDHFIPTELTMEPVEQTGEYEDHTEKSKVQTYTTLSGFAEPLIITNGNQASINTQHPADQVQMESQLPESLAHKEDVATKDDRYPGTSILVANLKPQLNMEIIEPSEQINMSDFQTHAATVASTLIDGVNTLPSDYSNNTNNEIALLLSDVIHQMSNDNDDSEKQVTNFNVNRFSNQAQLDLSFLMNPTLDNATQNKEAGSYLGTTQIPETTTAMEVQSQEFYTESEEKLTEQDTTDKDTTEKNQTESVVDLNEEYSSENFDETTTTIYLRESDTITQTNSVLDEKPTTTDSYYQQPKVENDREPLFEADSLKDTTTLFNGFFEDTTTLSGEESLNRVTEQEHVSQQGPINYDLKAPTTTLISADELAATEENTERATNVAETAELLDWTTAKVPQNTGNYQPEIDLPVTKPTTETPSQEKETTIQPIISTGSEEDTTDKNNRIEKYTTTAYQMSEETSAELNAMISEEDETNESADEDPYIKLGETTTPKSGNVNTSTNPTTATKIDAHLLARPTATLIVPETTTSTETQSSDNEPYEESDQEDEEDQYGSSFTEQPNVISSTTVSATFVKTTTTTKPKVITTRRLSTLKPVSYFNKQPAYALYKEPVEPLYTKHTSQSLNTQHNENTPIKVAIYSIASSQQRPMQRPPQLSNLMISSTQSTRPPVKLDPSPLNSKGLEASLANLDEDILTFAKLCNELAFSYWKSITSEKISSARSLVMSPFALTSMLSMVFLGARGSTSGEMNDVLKLDDMVTFNPHLVFKNITDSVERSFDREIATTAFVREIYSDRANGKVLQFFKEKTQQLYAGHVEEVNFHVVNDIIRRRTNLLVKRHTMGKVLEYLRTNSVWVNGPLATISANLFQTDCSYGSTQDRDGEIFFQVHPTVRQRRLVPVPAVLFKSGFTAGYEPNLDATVVAFGRIQDTTSMIYVMPGHLSSISPSDNLDRLEKQLVETAISGNTWSNLLTSLVDRPGMEVQIPRFSHRSFVNATTGLQKMGLKGLFKSDYADLGGLTGSSNRDIYLSDMIQINTFSTCGEEKIADHHHVELYPAPPLRKRNKDVDAHDEDEQDSSEDVIDFGSIVQDPVIGRGFYDDLLDPKYLELPLPLRPRQARVPEAPRIRFDKPFLYFVRHNPTGMILFMGRFNPRLLP